MGLIKTAAAALGGSLQDQFKEYVTCDSLDQNIIMKKGQKKTRERNVNNGLEDVISNGSAIQVADGQVALIVTNGKVSDIIAETGIFTYTNDAAEKTVFDGGIIKSLETIWNQTKERFVYGGEPPKETRVYYFNTKDMIGQKYGTPNPIPFKQFDESSGFKGNVYISMFGTYSAKLVNPMLFYQHISGNVKDEYTWDELQGQLKSELLTQLQPVIAQFNNTDFALLPSKTVELSNAMKEALTQEWNETIGIELVKFAVSSVTARDEDIEKMSNYQEAAFAGQNANIMAGMMGTAQAQAMRDAAKNPNGMGGFFGMGMANMMGNQAGQGMFGQGGVIGAVQGNNNQQSQAQGWKCECGTMNNGKFCQNCGKPQPQNSTWKCANCGKENTGKFCEDCGTKKPD